MPPQSTADPYAEWKGELKPDPYAPWKKVDPYAQWKGVPEPEEAVQIEFGKSAEYPHTSMHPELTKMDRFKIDFRGGNPEVGQRYLESKGFQVQPKGGFQYALRKGKGDWYLFDEAGPSFQDVSDVAGDVLSLGGLVGGAALTAPTGFTAGVLGAGAGTGVAQGVRIAAGEAMGVPSRAGEVAGEIGQEALAGSAAQVLGVGAGKLLGMGSKGLGRVRSGMRAKRYAKNKPIREARQAQGDIVKAVEALDPHDQAVVEFFRRNNSRRTAQKAGDLRTMMFQAIPDEEAGIRQLADTLSKSAATNPKFNHMTESQLAELFYRREVHGLTKKSVAEVVRLAKGMPKNEVDDMVLSLSPRMPVNPRKHNLFGPVVDLQARAAQTQALGKIPRADAIDFWRFIPIEGIRKVTLPGGKVIELTVEQAKAARHVIVDIATHGVPFRAKVGKVLTKLGDALQVPRNALYRGLKKTGMLWVMRWEGGGSDKLRSPLQRLAPRALGTLGVHQVSPFLGKAMGATYVSGYVGRHVERLGRMMIADTSGGILHSIGYTVSMRLSRKIQKVLGFLDRPGLYRLGVYELLRDPEFMEAAEEKITAPGGGGYSGMGVAPGA